jgi:hypothetical protein
MENNFSKVVENIKIYYNLKLDNNKIKLNQTHFILINSKLIKKTILSKIVSLSIFIFMILKIRNSVC